MFDNRVRSKTFRHKTYVDEWRGQQTVIGTGALFYHHSVLPVCCQNNHATQCYYLIAVLPKIHLNVYFISSYILYTLIFYNIWIFRNYLIYSSYSIRFEIFPPEEKTVQVFTRTSKKIFSHSAVCRTVSWFRRAQYVIILVKMYVGLLRMSILQMLRYTDDSLRWKMTNYVFKRESAFLFWEYFFDVVQCIM